MEVFKHALFDTLKLLPWLIIIYIIIELLERKTKLSPSHNRLSGKLGPLIGSATGLIPQCGFSVMAAKLFEQKYITVGTLLAIFLSTSDEAFIILLSSGTGAVYLLPLIVVKIFTGIIVGYLIDGIMKLFKKNPLEGRIEAHEYEHIHEHCEHDHCEHDHCEDKEDDDDVIVCTSCGRVHDDSRPWKVYFVDPLIHSLKVAFFIFIVNFILGLIMHSVSEETFKAFMNKNLFVQPFISSLIGLIPNCASSVVLTDIFLQGGISFGSCVAGLCANAGLGFVVLLKNTKEWKRNLILIVVTYVVSILVGVLVNGLSLLF